ncbi:MAG: hypothetical protein N2Z72_08345, partial [Bacteroidales bacterium]|nr:hypothetical protein [Bacteroidales bacterium]
KQNDSLGASYWGVFELSGNLAETVVSVGKATGRSFTGMHGDGMLDANGNANVLNWDVNGLGVRGGSFDNPLDDMRTSFRRYVNYVLGRQLNNGGRGGRNAHPVIP